MKGAYWDAEVKRAQELGLARYPVFTDKRLTDLSYLACARRLSAGLDSVYPQFATHNPVTLACVLALSDRFDGASAAPARFECQRLHGMGGALHGALAATHPHLPVRTYAPVGERRELFAYLVRRLLENSASTSYVICCAPVSNFSTRARARAIFPYQRSCTCRNDALQRATTSGIPPCSPHGRNR